MKLLYQRGGNYEAVYLTDTENYYTPLSDRDL
jgi:hypothetical protein